MLCRNYGSSPNERPCAIDISREYDADGDAPVLSKKLKVSNEKGSSSYDELIGDDSRFRSCDGSLFADMENNLKQHSIVDAVHGELLD